MQFAGISDALGVELQVTLCYVNANKPLFLHFTVSAFWVIGISSARYPDFKEPKRR